MAKWIAGLGALLVYGSLGVASVGGAPLDSPGPLSGEAHARADVEEGVAPRATAGSRLPVLIGEMSEDEKDRRRDACANDYISDVDWCARSTRGELHRECKERAWKRNVECLKRIR